MHLEKSINIPTLLCVACRASPATGVYTDGMIHAPLCLACSSKSDDSITTSVMETTYDVRTPLCQCVGSRLPRQSIPCLPSSHQSKPL